MLAQRADDRSRASRKKLVMADTTLCANMKEPKRDIEEGEWIREFLMRRFLELNRRPPGHGMRIILEFLQLPCRWHKEQCTLAEFSAYVARDVTAHIDLAAEARVKEPQKPQNDEESELESTDDENPRRGRASVELVDIGGGDDGTLDDETEDVAPGEFSLCPLRDLPQAIGLCFQQPDLDALATKTRKSQADLNMKKWIRRTPLS